MSRRDLIRKAERDDKWKLIQTTQREDGLKMSLAEAHASSQGEEIHQWDVDGWISTWAQPLVGLPWAEAWTRKETEVWAQAKKAWGAGKQVRTQVWAHEERLAETGTHVGPVARNRAGPRARTATRATGAARAG